MGNESAGIGMSFSFGPGKDRPGGGGESGERKPDPPRASFGAPGSVEVPLERFRILALGNFRGYPDARDAAPRRVRASTLDKDFAALAPILRVDVKDHLSGGEQPLEVEARLEARTDLKPDKLAARIPALAPLVRLLDDVDGLAAGKLDAGRVEANRAVYAGIKGLGGAVTALDRALRQRGSGGASSSGGGGGGALASVFEAGRKAQSGDSVLDNIFSMIDSGDAAPAPAAAAPAASSSGGDSGWKGALDQARQLGLELLERQLAEVLRHPQVRQVEGAWRGLELLLSRAPKEGEVEVEVWDCDLESPETALIHGVVRRHAAPDAPPPPSLVVLDAMFSRTAADVARLELIAEAAEALQAPVVVGLGDAFLGTDLPTLAGLDHPGGALERGLEKWNGARGNQTFRWLVGAANRVLLRAPWKRGERGARIGERIGGREDLTWGNPAWVVATAAAISAGRTGWPSDLTSPEGIEDLPMDPAAEPELRGPLEAPLALDAVEALAEVGVLALTGPRDRDAARITRAPTAHRAPQDEPRWLSGLPYQLVATRIAGALMRAKDRLTAAHDPEQVCERVERFAAGLVGDTGPGAGARAKLVGSEVEVEIRTGRNVLGGVSLVLGLNL